jgi:chromosome partitioning protein
VQITLCNGKGGAGKSTLAVLLCVAFQQMGLRVALKDRDPQGTASRWIEEAGDIELATDGSGPEVVVIDTPPRLDSELLQHSLAESDCAILVTSPSPADLWTSQDTVGVIRRHLPPGKPARLLFNQVQPRTLLALDLENLAERIGLPALNARVSRRQSFQHAALLGWSGLDTKSRAEVAAAAAEIKALVA